ncbi:MAG: ADP-dependent NAD(P)H-hydrate dehydratase [Acidobacteriota bacterium]|nr:ADP-dependent NAD(P)H-hydrate dehydratase [Acidobacteriota bacterium]
MPTRKGRATSTKLRGRAIEIDDALLRRLRLPELDEEADKESRGRVLIVAGSAQMPGAAVLAGTGALRAGAGKLQIATAASVAVVVGVAVPEARVFALPETLAGAIAGKGLSGCDCDPAEARAVLVGPGMLDGEASEELVREVVRLACGATLILDANALNVLAREPKLLKLHDSGAILTPHDTELSEMSEETEKEITRDRRSAALRSAKQFGAVVALKGRETFVASPHSKKVYVNHAGNVGLATSGSGDVLAGVIAGLAARGADALTATIWGVHAHALAGEKLARRVGRVGYLARELLDEIPAVLTSLKKG